MAQHFYGINIGDGFDPSKVVTGTSTTGKDIEIATTDGKALNKALVVKALETLEAYFTENQAFP